MTVRVEPGEIKEIIGKLRTRVAPGLDEIGNKIVKAAPETISTTMATIINACLQQGVFPDAWKRARLITLLKGPNRDRSAMSSYRPVCLLSTLGKLFEKVLEVRIQGAANEDPRQFGFKQGRNTTNAIEELTKYRESKEKHVVAIMLDISSAFDCIWWPSALMAPKENNCPRDVYKVLQDYFRNREVVLQEGAFNRRRSQAR